MLMKVFLLCIGFFVVRLWMLYHFFVITNLYLLLKMYKLFFFLKNPCKWNVCIPRDDCPM